MGNTRFVVELLRAYPDLIWKTNDDNYSIFHVAIMNRHQDIYNLMYEIGSMKDLITPLKDKDGNNMLHLVGLTLGKTATKTSRASLLMQRELLWFKTKPSEDVAFVEEPAQESADAEPKALGQLMEELELAAARQATLIAQILV
ncbi:Ankyrin repeat-containing protein [Artemisia annua]|uniref:Ankyrin repeat-containing protein n=1 Tax=Artemisia annua TaxID=35608 RepID=A0A2U1N2B0_ARTAN|nr:Ankyrin repeat-containing protein [Artemisia annua]